MVLPHDPGSRMALLLPLSFHLISSVYSCCWGCAKSYGWKRLANPFIYHHRAIKHLAENASYRCLCISLSASVSRREKAQRLPRAGQGSLTDIRVTHQTVARRDISGEPGLISIWDFLCTEVHKLITINWQSFQRNYLDCSFSYDDSVEYAN